MVMAGTRTPLFTYCKNLLLYEVKHFCDVLFCLVNDRESILCSSFTLSLFNFLYNFCSQSLVNLLVTGHAVSNVWDGDRECSGMSKTSTEMTAYTHKHAIFTLTDQPQVCGSSFDFYPSEDTKYYTPLHSTEGTK